VLCFCITVPPAITTSPGKVDGVKGRSATLKCEASGLPKPKYEFIKVRNYEHLCLLVFVFKRLTFTQAILKSNLMTYYDTMCL
jgi:hypothetical protein